MSSFGRKKNRQIATTDSNPRRQVNSFQNDIQKHGFKSGKVKGESGGSGLSRNEGIRPRTYKADMPAPSSQDAKPGRTGAKGMMDRFDEKAKRFGAKFKGRG
jgi:hypothetical protein